VVGQRNADIADILHLRDVAMATIFWLSIYGVHIGATWRIRLNRPYAAAMWPYVKLLWPLVSYATVQWHNEVHSYFMWNTGLKCGGKMYKIGTSCIWTMDQ